ncbi:MAG: SDR family oxidoreductase [Lachnospiraceae bacterium]|nr:SDR family oxidoreductase [Lachnospiraceae bacterium]
MNILITGAKGFVGRNLVENLKNIKERKDRTHPDIQLGDIMECDIDTEKDELFEYCRKADFVFHLAGVNRPKETEEKARADAYMNGNFGVSSQLLELLKKCKNTCPVMLSSSIQAALTGRFAGSEYGKSKLAGEELFFQYSVETGAKVLVYRFPNLFGKWCRPNYNSAIATFCNAVARDLDYVVNDRNTQLELLYIDDLVQEMLYALEGKEHRCEYPKDERYDGLSPQSSSQGRYCYVPVTYKAMLGEIVDLLEKFRQMPRTFIIPEIPKNSLEKKLYSTYLSYLPEASISYPITMNIDQRGVFAELIKTKSCGQMSINIANPGNVRGQHWHNSKWEIFIVVSGHGLIQERKIGIDPDTGMPYPVLSFEVRGEEMKAIQMLPGYTHNIINLSETEKLITVMWANEQFDPEHPDTFSENVE